RSPAPEAAATAVVDSVWNLARDQFARGRWSDAAGNFERVALELRPGDPRVAAGRFYLGEARLALGQHFEAAREFRRVADETPNDPLASRALLRAGDAFADLWNRPELDPSYGETARSTWQELRNRYPTSAAATVAQARLTALDEMFAEKLYKSGVYYHRLKAYNSGIIYFKDVVATYPRTAAAPRALEKLVEAYLRLGYAEDRAETCEYIRRFHPADAAALAGCPAVTAADTAARPPS
ncbi:MAG TPA: outer membrane protein assembly factor BamD, partial [Gemmatimonadales bacterium]|nr:outer membrane protein assembly factor BamD [Gemmatimonadales bacterium]